MCNINQPRATVNWEWPVCPCIYVLCAWEGVVVGMCVCLIEAFPVLYVHVHCTQVQDPKLTLYIMRSVTTLDSPHVVFYRGGFLLCRLWAKTTNPLADAASICS